LVGRQGRIVWDRRDLWELSGPRAGGRGGRNCIVGSRHQDPSRTGGGRSFSGRQAGRQRGPLDNHRGGGIYRGPGKTKPGIWHTVCWIFPARVELWAGRGGGVVGGVGVCGPGVPVAGEREGGAKGQKKRVLLGFFSRARTVRGSRATPGRACRGPQGSIGPGASRRNGAGFFQAGHRFAWRTTAKFI